MVVTAAGPWMADYGRIFKNESGDEAVCCGFSRGESGTFTRLMLREDPRIVLECEFTFSDTPWNLPVDWYAVDLWLTHEERMSLYAKAHTMTPSNWK